MAEPVRVYLDNNCIQRLFDDQRQERVRCEADAVERVFELQQKRLCELLASRMIYTEVMQNQDYERRSLVLAMLGAFRFVETQRWAERPLVQSLEQLNMATPDATHLAQASLMGADVFLTCDDGIIKKRSRVQALLPKLTVANPVQWVASLPEKEEWQ